MSDRSWCHKCFSYSIVRSLCRKCDGLCSTCGGVQLEGDCPKCLRKENEKLRARVDEFLDQPFKDCSPLGR